jgi:hypothetical protein
MMARFGEFALPHTLDAIIQETRVIIDRLVPGAKVGYRRDETAGGRVITVRGEIRDVDYALRLEELRVRQDDIARALDLEDGSAMINAKLGTIEHELALGSWFNTGKSYIPYSATFYETS